jgi:hypothetical protein
MTTIKYAIKLTNNNYYDGYSENGTANIESAWFFDDLKTCEGEMETGESLVEVTQLIEYTFNIIKIK